MIHQGSDAISNAAATSLYGGASMPIKWLTVQNRLGNGPMALGGVTLAALAGDGIVLAAGASYTFEKGDINNINEVRLWATNLNDPVDWTCGPRG